MKYQSHFAVGAATLFLSSSVFTIRGTRLHTMSLSYLQRPPM